MAALKKPAVKVASKPKKLSSDERSRRAAQRAFAGQVRTIFIKSGFRRAVDAADKEFKFKDRTSDFDDIFVRENVIVCTEYTLSQSSQLGDHIKNKAHIYNAIDADSQGFIAFLITKFPDVAALIPKEYHASQLRLRTLYCSQTELKAEHTSLAPNTKYLWYGSIRYFRSIANTVKLSARYELHEFLGIPFLEIGDGGKLPDEDIAAKFPGSLLPEAHSNFPPGYKVVSFYVSPGTILRRAYVLRKDGWKDATGLYQRMIDKDKIESIRRYLRKEERTFVNNVIVTLPDATRILDPSGNTVNPSTIDKTTPVIIQLPQTSNSVGVVDGQHRIFSYYEDTNEDQKIAMFRSRQNMLATGVMYPTHLSAADRGKFEAALFLEINSTQNAAKSDLKQAIAVLTAPFSPDSVGKRVIARLSMVGPLESLLERHFFDKDVLKTTSIVSYGLRTLVRIDGEESLFRLWQSEAKAKVMAGTSVDDLLDYVAFCATEINIFLGAAKAVMGSSRWSVRSKEGLGLLSVTSVNSFLILFRKVAHSRGLSTFDDYRYHLKALTTFDFSQYHSSQYNRMAEDILLISFGKPNAPAHGT